MTRWAMQKPEVRRGSKIWPVLANNSLKWTDQVFNSLKVKVKEGLTGMSL